MYEGERVRLRAYEERDVEVVTRLFNDWEVREHLALPYPVSRAGEAEWIAANRSPSYERFEVLIETREGQYLGGGTLRTKAPEVRVAELGIAIMDKGLWDQGYGTDAVRTLCRFGFEEMDLHRIELWVEAPNERARHVYAKLGFVEEGVAREAWFKRGRRLDMVLMGVLPGELR